MFLFNSQLLTMFLVPYSTTWTSEDCHPVAALQVSAVTTTPAVPEVRRKVVRRAEEQAVIRPSDSLGWPEGAKGIHEEPEFHSCSSSEPVSNG